MQLIKAQAIMPHVLLLQETLSEKVNLSGYRSVSQKGENGRGIATFVRKDTSFQEHEVKICNSDKKSGLEAQLIEIIPTEKFDETFSFSTCTALLPLISIISAHY